MREFSLHLPRLLRRSSFVGLLLVSGWFARAATPTATLTVQADQPGAVISRHLYGQFAEHLGHGIYEGIWVGPDSPIPNVRGYRQDVLEALRRLHVPQLRWPGGCFADEYHWKDGIGPREQRPSVYNSNWGGVVENNHFGTHEFLDLCELLGIEPYISLNVGSGTVQEAMEWVEYMTSPASSPMANLRRAHGRAQPWRVHYFGIGNESWGCGGSMTAEYYAENFRRYATFVKNYAGDEHRLHRIACGPSSDDYKWTETLMQRAPASLIDGLSLHHYTIPTGDWAKKGSSTDFTEAEYFATLRGTLFMDELIQRHSEIMDRYDPKKKIGLMVDEWGIWTDPEPGTNAGFLRQQNSLRDAILAALNLHLFQAHADRVKMANIAQMVNVLQAMILTDGPRMILTPTYHVFEMLQVHQDATSLPVALETPAYRLGQDAMPAVSASASRDAAGHIHLSLTNADPQHDVPLSCQLAGVTPRKVTGRILTAPAITSHNTFAAPHTVEPAAFDQARLAGQRLTLTLPARSVVVLTLE